MEWQPIETAPKDGTWVFLYVPGHGPTRAKWSRLVSGVYGWTSHQSGNYISRATHWMPLPEPPEEK